MGIANDGQALIVEHRDHGRLVGDATEPIPNGYQVTIACPSGVIFIPWVTPDDAAIDLPALARLK